MKKTISLIVALIALVVSSVSSSGFSFALVPDEPLFKESVSDPYAFTTAVHVMMIPKAEDNEFKIKALVKDSESNYSYMNLPVGEQRDWTKLQNKLYVNMKLAADASFLRLRFEDAGKIPSFDFDLNLLGYINGLFFAYGGADAIDFDGSFQLSGSLRIADIFTVRAGIHHFSGHYGDEILNKMYSFNKVDFSGNGKIGDKQKYLCSEVEYVRDNSWIVGLQTELSNGLRVFGQCEIPQKTAWIRPFIHVPANFTNPLSKKPNDPETSLLKNGSKEGAGETVLKEEESQKSGSRYLALRLQGGIEYTYRLSWANIILSADVQAHQDGQNRNSNGEHDILSYKSSNPWEFEYTAGGALEFTNSIANRNVRIEAFYHNGRVPATQWFYKTGSFVYVGFGLR